MSSRHLRKVFGNVELPAPEDSDEDFEPLYTKSASTRFQLEDSDENSKSESEHVSSISEEEQPVPVAKKKKNKKKKKKGNNLNREFKDDDNELDEVERSVREVNEMLGEVTVASKPQASKVAQETTFMSINPKHLNAYNEMKRMFGADVVQSEMRPRRNNRPVRRTLKKTVIVPIDDYVDDFAKDGLSMSLQRTENGISYFTFDHNEYYRKIHKVFLKVMKYKNTLNVMPFRIQMVEDRRMHVEGWLEYCDTIFSMDMSSVAKGLLEQSIAYLHYVAHPSFNLSNPSIRLEYKYLENQPFHEAVLRYMYLLTNKACHRTALELAKLLLNLDPTDPLAILLVIDALALRCREHQWLIEAIDVWTKERNASFLHNMAYSHALARFHVDSSKDDGDISSATSLLRKAMLLFPSIVMPLFRAMNQQVDERLASHDYFNKFSDESTRSVLKELSQLYAKFTCTKWKEPRVLKWFTDTAIKLVADYDNFASIKNTAQESKRVRMYLFQSAPNEINRHLFVIKPMWSLLSLDTLVTLASHEPDPPRPLINRYKYEVTNTTTEPVGTPLYELLRSLLPDSNINQVPDDVAAIIRGERVPERANEDDDVMESIFEVIMQTFFPTQDQENRENQNN